MGGHEVGGLEQNWRGGCAPRPGLKPPLGVSYSSLLLYVLHVYITILVGLRRSKYSTRPSQALRERGDRRQWRV